VTSVVAPVGLAGPSQPAGAPAVVAPIAPAAPVAVPAPAIANTPLLSTIPATATTSVPALTPSPAAMPPAPPAPGVPPPPLADGQGFGYLVGTGYIELPLQARTKSAANVPIAEIAAPAPVTLSTPPESRARRRLRSVIDRGYRYDFLDARDEPDADTVGPVPQRYAASDRGSGPLGFAGTEPKGIGQASGLSTVAGDEFGGGPRMPMLPGSWNPETSEEDDPS
ncbi:MAG: PPE family protein, partial [Mycobacterium sp.]